MQYEFKPASMRDAAQGIAAMWTAAAQAYEPTYKAMARGNLELMSLASRRAQAVMDLPGKLVACRTPMDVLNAQMNFWQSASKQYGESASKYWDGFRGIAEQTPGWNPFAVVTHAADQAEQRETRRPSREHAAEDRRAA